MSTTDSVQDAIIIGAGPAGLTAATYLGRYRRRCLVLEDGKSRARWIPSSHNIPGFAAGIGGEALLASLRDQAGRYGACIRRARVTRISIEDGTFVLTCDAAPPLRARFVLLATGVRDHLPELAGAPEAVMRSVLRFCPICDAYEAIDRRIAVIGNGPLGEREADFLRTYSEDVTLLDLGGRAAGTAAASGKRIRIALSDLTIETDRILVRAGAAGALQAFDVMYLALGCSPQHALAKELTAACDAQGALLVNAHQETSVARLYAAGDVVRGLNQVIVAAAEAAIAATDIHNKLRALQAQS
jgi:thioredoxin reductase (NADPH)